MWGLAVELPSQDAEQVVRRFYKALEQGRMVEALDLFAPGAVIRDAEGQESSGIREIATSLLPYRTAHRIFLERIERQGPEVRATVRTAKHRFLSVFAVNRGRIRSLQMERL